MRQPRTPKAALYPLDAGAPEKAAAKANQACHSCKRQVGGGPHGVLVG